MSKLVDSAIAAAGLAPLEAARARGDVDGLQAFASLLATADLLVVGALADRIRAREVGDVVRIYANVEAECGPAVVQVSPLDGPNGTDTGLALLRRVAVARIMGALVARVRVDWGQIGLDVAQVALGFGASELAGPIANRRGLPIADAATLKVKGGGRVSVQAMKKKELESLLKSAGRTALFETARSSSFAVTELSHA